MWSPWAVMTTTLLHDVEARVWIYTHIGVHLIIALAKMIVSEPHVMITSSQSDLQQGGGV